MDIQEFVVKINEIGFGVIFNAHRHDKTNYCFIMITERGNSGIG